MAKSAENSLTLWEKHMLKPLKQIEPNFSGMLFGRSFTTIAHFVSGGQKTWPPVLKIEHEVKLQYLANSSKTVTDRQNLT